jgi:hypothetical protein
VLELKDILIPGYQTTTLQQLKLSAECKNLQRVIQGSVRQKPNIMNLENFAEGGFVLLHQDCTNPKSQGIAGILDKAGEPQACAAYVSLLDTTIQWHFALLFIQLHHSVFCTK